MNERVQVLLAQAYLLHSRDYRDTSLIADLFTRDHGRVSVVARGARRPKSRLKSVLSPFQPLLVSWTAKGSLGTMTAVEVAKSVPKSLGKNVLSAFYVNEIIMRALKSGDSNPEVFTLYTTTLDSLRCGVDIEKILRLFERDLLELLGYGLQLSIDQQGRTICKDVTYCYDVLSGPSVISQAEEHGRQQANEKTFRGEVLLALDRGTFQHHEQLQSAKQLLRIALNYHLGYRESKVKRVATQMRRHLRN